MDVSTARLARPPEDRPDHPRGDRRDRRAGDARAGADAGGAVGDERAHQHPHCLQAAEPALRPALLPRGDDDVPRAGDPVLQATAAALVPLLDEGARRAPAARRAVARARVHHEGLVLVRPRRGRARQELRGAPGRVRADLGTLRSRGVLRRGRVGDHGRPGVLGLHGAGRIRREHPRPLREQRLLRRLRRGARDSACARLPRSAGPAGRD